MNEIPENIISVIEDEIDKTQEEENPDSGEEPDSSEEDKDADNAENAAGDDNTEDDDADKDIDDNSGNTDEDTDENSISNDETDINSIDEKDDNDEDISSASIASVSSFLSVGTGIGIISEENFSGISNTQNIENDETTAEDTIDEEPLAEETDQSGTDMTDEIPETNSGSSLNIRKTADGIQPFSGGEEYSGSYTVTFANDKEQPVLYSLSVSKTDNYGKPVKGAVFDVSRQEGRNTIYIATLTTNEAGKTPVLKDLPEGMYFIEEVEVPYGYRLLSSDNLTKVSLPDNSMTDGHLTVEIKNELIEKEIGIIKVEIDLTSINVNDDWVGKDFPEMSGVTFELRKENEMGNYEPYPDKNNYIHTTNGTGEIPPMSLTLGNYYLKEIIPDGYSGVADTYFTVTENMEDNLMYYIPNFKEPGIVSVSFRKAADTPDGQPVYLEDAVFDLYRYNGNSNLKDLIESKPADYSLDDLLGDTSYQWSIVESHLRTDSQGIITADGLYKGETYGIIEVQPPNGYEQMQRYAAFSVDDNTYTLHGGNLEHVSGSFTIGNGQITVYNLPEEQFPEFELYKRNEDGEVLEGAVFGLFKLKDGGNPNNLDDYSLYASSTSQYDGRISIPTLVEGIYYVKEIQPPAGYDLKEEIFNFEAKLKNGNIVIYFDGQIIEKDKPVEHKFVNKKTVSPTPEPDPDPNPTPEPTPTPDVEDKDKPDPDPTPTPEPTPTPTPEPIPTPEPTPTPTPDVEEPDTEYPEEPADREKPDRELPPVTVTDEETEEEYTLIYIPEEDIYEVYDQYHNLIGHMKIPVGAELQEISFLEYLIPVTSGKLNPKTTDTAPNLNYPAAVSVLLAGLAFGLISKKERLNSQL